MFTGKHLCQSLFLIKLFSCTILNIHVSKVKDKRKENSFQLKQINKYVYSQGYYNLDIDKLFLIMMMMMMNYFCGMVDDKSFFSLNCFPLIWIFHSRIINNKVNRIHERCLRLLCGDKSSSFEKLLEQDKSVTIHTRNL